MADQPIRAALIFYGRQLHRGKEMIIYFFSGTGNSLFVAKELSKRLENTKVVPIIPTLKQKKIQPSDSDIVVVFPEHALTMPIIVRKFFRKLNFSGINYFSIVVTRHGIKSKVHEEISQIAKRKNGKLNSIFYINMFNNDEPLTIFV